MGKPRIAIIMSTTRATRFADKPAQWIHDLAVARGDMDVELVDLRDYPMPFFDEPASNAYVPSANEVAQRWQEKVGGFDGYIFVTAEYNHGISGVLKNALDYAYPFKWVASRLSGKKMTEQDVERQASLQRLRSRKSEVTEQVEIAKASTRFEAAESGEPQSLAQILDSAGASSAPTEKRASTPSMSQKDEKEGYTSRLLAAKKAAQKKPDSESN